MVPCELDPPPYELSRVLTCSRYLDQVARGTVLKTFGHNIYEYIVPKWGRDRDQVKQDGERLRGTEIISCS